LSLVVSLLYRVLPVVKIAWTALFKTSLAVALLFTVGKLILGIVIGRNGTISAYGAAGSLIALLLWIFYSTQILYLGAAAVSLYAEDHPRIMNPRYGGKDAVLKVEKRKVPLVPDLPHRLLNSFLEGWQEGWNNKRKK
jgi:membrane protein